MKQQYLGNEKQIYILVSLIFDINALNNNRNVFIYPPYLIN
jgi:hypothetical protein